MLNAVCTQCGVKPPYTTGGLCEDCHHKVMMASAINKDDPPVIVNDEAEPAEVVVRTPQEIMKYALDQRQLLQDPKMALALDVRERMARNAIGVDEVRKRATGIEGQTPDGKLSAQVLYDRMTELFEEIIGEAGLRLPGEGFEHLKPVDEHNILKKREYEIVSHTGVLCPACEKGELIRKSMCIDFMNDPPRVWTVCDQCQQSTILKA